MSNILAHMQNVNCIKIKLNSVILKKIMSEEACQHKHVTKKIGPWWFFGSWKFNSNVGPFKILHALSVVVPFGTAGVQRNRPVKSWSSSAPQQRLMRGKLVSNSNWFECSRSRSSLAHSLSKLQTDEDEWYRLGAECSFVAVIVRDSVPVNYLFKFDRSNR